jgi:hypothetical protein
MLKDGPLEALQRLPRLDAELIHEHPSGLLVRKQCVGLPS